MNTTEILLVPAITGEPSATAIAFEKRDALVIDAAKIRSVVTAEDATLADQTTKDLKAFLRDIETARKEAVAPALARSRAINDLADNLCMAVDAEKDRLSKLVGAYLLEQRRLADEAARKAREEEQRILNEAAAKAQAAIDSGRNIDAKLERIDAKAFQQVAEVKAAALSVAAPTFKGTALRTEPAFEITDIHALYKAHPELVKIEIDRAALKFYLKKFPKAELPGVRHWVEAATASR